MGQLLRKHLGPRWTPPMSDGVARASSGNPFLALMIAEAMQSDLSRWCWSAQDSRGPVFPVPPSLAGLLAEKVTLLPQGSRDVLLLVSAAGRLNVAQLQGIVESAQLRSALEAAADAEVAAVGAEAVVTFTHPLLASAIYDAATRRRTSSRTRALAEKLDDPVERARHRSRTITAPDEHVASRAGAGGIHLARTRRSTVGRRAVASRSIWPPQPIRTPPRAWAAGSTRWTAIPPPATRSRLRRRWTRGRGWQRSRSRRPRCWCADSGWSITTQGSAPLPRKHSGWRPRAVRSAPRSWTSSAFSTACTVTARMPCE